MEYLQKNYINFQKFYLFTLIEKSKENFMQIK